METFTFHVSVLQKVSIFRRLSPKLTLSVGHKGTPKFFQFKSKPFVFTTSNDINMIYEFFFVILGPQYDLPESQLRGKKTKLTN